jgi:hypothetical protein
MQCVESYLNSQIVVTLLLAAAACEALCPDRYRQGIRCLHRDGNPTHEGAVLHVPGGQGRISCTIEQCLRHTRETVARSTWDEGLDHMIFIVIYV